VGEAGRAEVRLVAVAVAVAALSALVIAPAPSYDPWAWLLWGREIAHGTLSTAEGPAFKPLPVAVTALLSVLGGAAPVAWVLVARAGGVLAVLLAFRVGRRLGGVAAGVVAATGVALCGDLVGYSAAGAEPGWTIALALAGVEAWRAGRPRAALACGVACALLRVEAWPFLLALGVLLWRRPQDRALLVACAVAVPAFWLVPEWLGSGDVLRSSSRARTPNPGQPATEAIPALAALREAAALPLWPLWVGVLATPRAARPLLVAGVAWIALVAAMAQAGFSGEPRYSLPGGALVAIAGAAGLVGLVRAAIARSGRSAGTVRSGRAVRSGRSGRSARTVRSGRSGRSAGIVRSCRSGRSAGIVRSCRAVRSASWAAPALAGALLVVAAAPKLADLPDLRRDQAYQRGLAADLRRVIVAAGGRETLLACGRPYVGELRGPLLAYHLDVEKRRVAFVPGVPGAVFRSRLAPDAPVEPATGPAFTQRAREGRWTVVTAC
jgi:hypothetical protein